VTLNANEAQEEDMLRHSGKKFCHFFDTNGNARFEKLSLLKKSQMSGTEI